MTFSPKEGIQDMATRKVPISALQAQFENEGIVVVKKDLYNLSQANRNAQLEGLTAVQGLKDELERGEKFHEFDAITHEDNTRATRIFFAHTESINFLKKATEVLLLDCTHKTNRFHMSFLNICAGLGNGRTLQVVLAFLGGEKEPDYAWVLDSVKRLPEVHRIAMPKRFEIDRELVLMKCLDTLFPQSDHLLCRWHIKMNIVANTKQIFKDQEA